MNPTMWKSTNKHRATPIEKLMQKIGFERKYRILDLTTAEKTASKLTEHKITCLDTDKDAYTYYFLATRTGKTVVFVNSISAARRLATVLSQLRVTVYPLHGQMQQRQRLKNLDRFRNDNRGILIATDVAARGLDIPQIVNVVHYHIPRTPQLYVHRSGRTARAQQSGSSVALIGPTETKYWNKILYELNKSDIAVYSVSASRLDAIKRSVVFAGKLEKAEHTVRKRNAEKNWKARVAEDIDVSVSESESDGEKRESTETLTRKAAALRNELNATLRKLESQVSK